MRLKQTANLMRDLQNRDLKGVLEIPQEKLVDVSGGGLFYDLGHWLGGFGTCGPTGSVRKQVYERDHS